MGRLLGGWPRERVVLWRLGGLLHPAPPCYVPRHVPVICGIFFGKIKWQMYGLSGLIARMTLTSVQEIKLGRLRREDATEGEVEERRRFRE